MRDFSTTAELLVEFYFNPLCDTLVAQNVLMSPGDSNKGVSVTSAGWQVTLCDPMWHVSSRSGVATLRTAIHLLLTYLLTCVGSLAEWLTCWTQAHKGLGSNRSRDALG